MHPQLPTRPHTPLSRSTGNSSTGTGCLTGNEVATETVLSLYLLPVGAA